MIQLELAAVVAPLVASHFGPAPVVKPVGEPCAAAIPEFYADWHRFTSEAPRQIAVARDGRYALVSWTAGETGGTDLYERRASSWCQISHGGGAMTAAEAAGLDGLGRAQAQRLFEGPFTSVKLPVHA